MVISSLIVHLQQSFDVTLVFSPTFPPIYFLKQQHVFNSSVLTELASLLYLASVEQYGVTPALNWTFLIRFNQNEMFNAHSICHVTLEFTSQDPLINAYYDLAFLLKVTSN